MIILGKQNPEKSPYFMILKQRATLYCVKFCQKRLDLVTG